MEGELSRRWLVAGVGIPVGVLVIVQGGWLLALAVASLAALGARELFELARARGNAPFPWLGVPAAALMVVFAARDSEFAVVAAWTWVLVLGLTLCTLVFALWLRGPGGNPLDAVGATVVGSVYAGGTLSFALLIREFPGQAGASDPRWEGVALLLFPLAVTWAADSAAYFAGRRWGRRKLFPSVSPGKTVAGGVAALVGALGAAAIFGHFFLSGLASLELTALHVLFMGGIIGVVAQVGDLAESLLKRAAGVKDSGGVLPGHGGILDRFDSLYLVLPVSYGLLVLIGRLV